MIRQQTQKKIITPLELINRPINQKIPAAITSSLIEAVSGGSPEKLSSAKKRRLRRKKQATVSSNATPLIAQTQATPAKEKQEPEQDNTILHIR